MRDCIAERRALPGSATAQGELWGARAVDWARLQEPRQRTLYRTAFEALSLGSGTRPVSYTHLTLPTNREV